MKAYQVALLAAGAVVAGVTVVVAPGFILDAVFGSPCGNQPLAEVRSPGGARKAVVFQRDCGATTGFTTQVSVLPPGGDLPDDGGNVFVADDDDGAAPAGPGGGPAVYVAWLDDTRMVIRHHPRARVFRAEPRVGPVEVRYELR
jgi:hypothetical protein